MEGATDAHDGTSSTRKPSRLRKARVLRCSSSSHKSALLHTRIAQEWTFLDNDPDLEEKGRRSLMFIRPDPAYARDRCIH